jgi:hypothetical protein
MAHKFSNDINCFLWAAFHNIIFLFCGGFYWIFRGFLLKLGVGMFYGVF